MEEMKYMWYDTFDNTYTKTIDENAPPERYVMTYRGLNNYTYEENWYVGERQSIGIAYSAEQYDSGECAYVRKSVADHHGVTLKKIRYQVLPADRYDKYEIEFGL